MEKKYLLNGFGSELNAKLYVKIPCAISGIYEIFNIQGMPFPSIFLKFNK